MFFKLGSRHRHHCPNKDCEKLCRVYSSLLPWFGDNGVDVVVSFRRGEKVKSAKVRVIQLGKVRVNFSGTFEDRLLLVSTNGLWYLATFDEEKEEYQVRSIWGDKPGGLLKEIGYSTICWKAYEFLAPKLHHWRPIVDKLTRDTEFLISQSVIFVDISARIAI